MTTYYLEVGIELVEQRTELQEKAFLRVPVSG
jgi:hypothetical protein